MSKIIPIKGIFESPEALLHHILETIQIDSFAIFMIDKNGEPYLSHFNVSYGDLAYFSLVLGRETLNVEE